jgi:hypothetical protein
MFLTLPFNLTFPFWPIHFMDDLKILRFKSTVIFHRCLILQIPYVNIYSYTLFLLSAVILPVSEFVSYVTCL